MTRAELEEAVRAILLEQMGGPQVLSLDLPQVQVTDADRLDTAFRLPVDEVQLASHCRRAPG